MKERIDEVLRYALAPEQEPDPRLEREILDAVRRRGEEAAGRKAGWRVRWSAAAVAAALALCAGSVTVYAAWRYLSPSRVAETVRDSRLAEAFWKEGASVSSETQHFGDYSVTLLGLVSGEQLSEYVRYKADGTAAANRTYAVIAVERTDGAPMPDPSEEEYGERELFASVLIGGYDPALYNIASMSGDYMDITEDGILYRILACDSVEPFADHDLYLCVSEGSFYDPAAYCYEEATGRISRNPEYEGLNALFALPLDASCADPERAAEYMAGLGLETDILEDKLTADWDGSLEAEVTEANRQGVEIAEYALEFLSNPYVYGQESLTEGTDCSGFTRSVYAHFDISLPHTASGQRELGTAVEGMEQAEPGDLFFYQTPSHVAIYLGDGKIVHAMPHLGICVSEADFDEIAEIRRIWTAE